MNLIKFFRKGEAELWFFPHMLNNLGKRRLFVKNMKDAKQQYKMPELWN